MKRDDIIAGVIGGSILVIGCTVGLFGYLKLHEPVYVETSSETTLQTEQTRQYEDYYSDSDYSYQNEDNTVSLTDPDNTDSDYIAEKEESIPVPPPVDDYDVTGEISSASDESLDTDSDLEVIESNVIVPSNNETQVESYNSNDDIGSEANFNKYDIEEQQNTTDQFVLNTKTLKIHYPKCDDVKKIKPENYATSNSSKEELISQGYSLCGHCFR